MENNIENYQIEQAEALMEDLELASEKTGEVLKQVRILMRRRVGKMEMEQLEHFPQVILMPSTQDTNLLGNKTNRDSTLEISNETGKNGEIESTGGVTSQSPGNPENKRESDE